MGPRGSHCQFVLGIDSGFAIEEKAHGHAEVAAATPWLPAETSMSEGHRRTLMPIQGMKFEAFLVTLWEQKTVRCPP